MTDGPPDRLYPSRPIVAVSAAVFRGSQVLVTRRGRAPMIGRWSLPGGVVEVGETLTQALARELDEEVGIEAEVLAFNRHVEPILRENEQVKAHFVIVSFVARLRRGKPRISEEVDAFLWIEPEACGDLWATPGLAEIVASAAAIKRGLQ